jgi:hypothetical protein
VTALLHANEMGESALAVVGTTVGGDMDHYMDIAGFGGLSKMQSQRTAGDFP